MKISRLLIVLSLSFILRVILFSFDLHAQKSNSISINSIIVNRDTVLIEDLDEAIVVIRSHDMISFDLRHEYSSERMSFYLEGLDEGWGPWSYQNYVSYNNLEKGNYTFKLRVDNLQSNIKVEVEDYFYFWLLCLIICLLGLLFLVRKSINVYITKSISEFKKLYNNENNQFLNRNRDENSKTNRRSTEKYSKVTVLFADIQGFTKIVEHLNPETLIDELDRFFIRFDEVVEKYQIEKIKTIGDAYMCAGGIPNKNSTNPVEVILAALEMQALMKQANIDDNKAIQDFWEVRIGIHTGPVISGTIGRKKMSFDIWGDSVNIASRMESSGIAGRINVSGITYELVKDFFDCEYRGKMPIKYKGETDMYFINSILPDLSVNGEGILPNEIFNTKFKWIQYSDIEEIVLNKLEEGLSTDLYYHGLLHTIDVCTQVEIIGRGENLNEYELLLVKVAALFHDTGFLEGVDNHELESVKIATEILKQFGYTDDEISIISDLILATKQTAKPETLLEEVLKDADLDYLGRADFILLSEKLWKEMCIFKQELSLTEWNEYQLKFLTSHKYYTQTARSLRQVKKEMQVKKISDLLKV